MIGKSEKNTIPDYIQQFECVKSSCEDNCCSNLNAEIDFPTFNTYRRLNNKDLKEIIKKYISIASPIKNKKSYAIVKPREDGSCPFFTHERLCMLHNVNGKKYLPQHCDAHPFVTNIVNGRLEKSASMSCPEIARIALLNPKGINFTTANKLYHSKNYINAILNTSDNFFKNSFNKYFYDLRFFTINILQDRTYSLNDRILFLGLFFQEVSNLHEQKKINDIPTLIATFSDKMNSNLLPDTTSTQYTFQLELLMFIATREILRGTKIHNYIQCFNDFLKGIKYTKEITLDKLALNFHKAYENYYNPYMKMHEYILENYLVNTVFKDLFPFTREESIFDEYILLVTIYSLIKMHLVGISGYYRVLNDELIIKLIYSLSRSLEQNYEFYDQTLKLFKSKELNTMDYIISLMKI